jgi:hypothetical protein
MQTCFWGFELAYLAELRYIPVTSLEGLAFGNVFHCAKKQGDTALHPQALHRNNTVSV